MTIDSKSSRPKVAERICVGVITGAHGIGGTLKVKSFTDPADAFAGYVYIFDEWGKQVVVEILGQTKGQFLTWVSGVTTRNDAERVKGTGLYVDREVLRETNEGEYYHVDLIGMEVMSHDGKLMGTVKGVENFGSCDLLDIKGHERKDFLMPFTEGFVPEVNLAERKIVLAYYEETE